MKKNLFILTTLILTITITMQFCSSDDTDVNTVGPTTSTTTNINDCPINAPTKIRASDDLTGKIQISWDAVENASSYNIYRSTSSDGTYEIIDSTANTSYEDIISIDKNDDNSLDNRFIQYFYKISAYKEGCNELLQSVANSGLSINNGLDYIIDTYIDSALINDLAVDSNNNLYLVGNTSKEMDGQNVYGNGDIILIKYSATGEKLWTRISGTPQIDRAVSIVLDKNENVLITGNTSGALEDNVNNGRADIFIMKYSSNGEKLWTKLLGTPEIDVAMDIALDNNDNIIVTGYTYNDIEDQKNKGDADIFISKFTNNGEKLWTKLDGSTKFEMPYKGKTNKSGDIIVSGFTEGNFDGYENLGEKDVFLVKYSPNGEKLWTKMIATDKYENVYDININENNEIFITGITEGYLDKLINYGNGDIYLAKYSSDGNKLWTKLSGSRYTDIGTDINIDNNKNVFVAGITSGKLDSQENKGDYDIFISKHNSSEVKLWTRLIGSNNTDSILDLEFDSNNYAIIIGYSELNEHFIYNIIKLNLDN